MKGRERGEIRGTRLEERGAGNCGAIEFIEFKDTSLESGETNLLSELDRELSIVFPFLRAQSNLSFLFQPIN